MVRQRRDSQGGFSLVETMVAMAVLSIMLLSGMSMFAVAQHGLSEGARSLEVMALVESKLERMRTAPYHTLLSDVLYDNGILLTWSVRPDQPVLARSGVATIKVTAEWSDHRGRRRTIQSGMLRANPIYGGGAS